MKHNLLKKKSKKIRLDILNTIMNAGKGHIGGALSCVEILVTLYYCNILKFNRLKPKWKYRDRFIFSKGHASIAHYVVLADLNFFSKKELNYFNKPKGKIAEHPDTRLPGIETVSGSLGHGLGIGAGIAFSHFLKNKKKIFTYVLLGDGECNEGSVWETAMFASHHKLSNLIVIVDRNMMSVLDKTENIISLEPFKDKWKSFGWNVKVVDGHNIKKLYDTLSDFKSSKINKPHVLIAKTKKGKGISFMENKIKWHHGLPNNDEYLKSIKELN